MDCRRLTGNRLDLQIILLIPVALQLLYNWGYCPWQKQGYSMKYIRLVLPGRQERVRAWLLLRILAGVQIISRHIKLLPTSISAKSVNRCYNSSQKVRLSSALFPGEVILQGGSSPVRLFIVRSQLKS